MTTTTAETIQTIDQIATLAREIAEARAFAYTGNYGRGEFRYVVRVITSDGQLSLVADTNARISEKRASSELAAVWTELTTRLDETTRAAYGVAKVRGFKIWRTGFTNMGVHCTTGFARGMKRRATVTA